MITQTYNLNLIPDRVPVIVNCSQYDANSRTIEMVIYDGSVLYTIPSGVSATVRGTKSDNTGFEYPCTIDGSKVSFGIKDQMTIFAGKVPCEIRLADANGFVGTCNFLLNVEETPLDPDVTISETDLPLLEEAEQNAIRAEQARDEAEQILSSTVKSVNGETPDANGNVDVIALPTGGTTGQVLTKQSSADRDANWETAGMWHGDEVGSLPVPINADQLQGHPASYFQPLLTAGEGISIVNNTVANTLIYHVGDAVTFPNNVYIGQGAIGTNAKNISFIINLPKPISSDVSGVTFSSLNIRPFSVGGQLFSGNVLTSTYGLLITVMHEQGAIRVQITKADDTAFSATALTPVSVFFSSLAFTFN